MRYIGQYAKKLEEMLYTRLDMLNVHGNEHTDPLIKLFKEDIAEHINAIVEASNAQITAAKKLNVLHIDALGLMKRNQDIDVIMHLVFQEPDLKAVATKLGVDKSEVFDAMTPKQAQLVSWLITASAVLASTGLDNNDEMRRKKLRKLYDSTLFAFK